MKEQKFSNHKISHIRGVHWRHLMNTSQWSLIIRGIPHVRTKLFTSNPHKCALTFIVVNYLHLKCWIMKLRLLMVQKWNPQHFKLPASLLFLASSLYRSLCNSCVLESHFGKLRWLVSHTFCVSDYICGRKGVDGRGYSGKKCLRHWKKKKAQWQFIYSLLLCFSRCLICKRPISFILLTQMSTCNIFIME